MSALLRVVLLAAGVAAAASIAFANGIDPGLWRIVHRTETGGVIGPPHEIVQMPYRRGGQRPAQDILAHWAH